MSTKVETNSAQITFLQSPQLIFFTLFAAVVVGIFPPKLSSMAFWALLPVYIAALDAWFGVLAWARYTPYLDRPLFRILALNLVLAWTMLLALMFFASKVPDSLMSYLWGLVIWLGLATLGCFVRYRAMKNPEPFAANIIPGMLALAIAITYTIWLYVYSPIPDMANWIFVFIAFTIIIGMRVWLKVSHAWHPEEKHQS